MYGNVPEIINQQPQSYPISPPHKHTRVVIKTKEGQEVNFKPSQHKKSSSISSQGAKSLSSTTTPNLTPATLAGTTPKLPSKPTTAQSSPDASHVEQSSALKKTNEDFKAAFLANLKKKKVPIAPPEEDTNSKASTPAIEKTTTIASTPVAEAKAPAVSEAKPVETKSEPVKVEEKKPEPKAAETAKPVEEKKPVVADVTPVKKEEVKPVVEDVKKEKNQRRLLKLYLPLQKNQRR
ncbi:unnamed protein product [Ambrosiozyma monospora]|uniref:Unnamed protein product n=1 Tax=Ambrosiozyma monospora TaxID=43982 RepID=A0A9W6T2F2_AMBMO|nr:unnamed protein product [Ambrosiozyma monospora]